MAVFFGGSLDYLAVSYKYLIFIQKGMQSIVNNNVPCYYFILECLLF